MTLPDWMQSSFFGNSLADWSRALGGAVAVTVDPSERGLHPCRAHACVVGPAGHLSTRVYRPYIDPRLVRATEEWRPRAPQTKAA